MKLLVVSPYPPRRDGLQGGCRSIARTVAELAPGNRLRLLALQGDDELPTEPALAELCESVEHVRRPGAAVSWERVVRITRSLFQGMPLWAGNWAVPAFEKRLITLAEEWRPDVVQFHFHLMGQYRSAVALHPAVLVVHEPGTAACRQRRNQRETRAWERYERRVFQDFQALVVLSARDHDEVEALVQGRRIEIIAPTVPISAPPPLPSPAPASKTVLFPGNYVHPPNVVAAERLARNIFPLLTRLLPDTQLSIAGAAPPARIRALEQPGITVTGQVPDLRVLTDAAAVIALPITTGGGVRVKAMETLSGGKAVVASSLAVEGLNLTPGREFVQADSDLDFAQAIAGLLENVERRRELGEAAISWSQEFCRPGRLGEAYHALFASITTKGTPGNP